MSKTLTIGTVAAAAALAIVGVWLLGWGRVPGTGTTPAAETRSATDLSRAESRASTDHAASRETVADWSAARSRTLRLIREEGEPVAEAAITAFADAKILAEATTNADGAATFPGLADGSQLWVVAPGHIPCVLAIPAPPARDVVLPRGEVVSGIVLVDEQPPASPLKLRLRGDKQWPAPPPEFPKNTLGGAFDPRLEFPTKTGAGGSFVFDGLPAGFAGSISTPWGYPFVGERDWSSTKRLDRAQDNLILRVTRLPKIRGRLVDAKTNEPAASRAISFDLLGPGGSSGGNSTDKAGRFSWDVPSHGTLHLRIWDEGRAGGTPLVERDVELSRDVDLGDIPFVVKRRVVLVVVDAAGAPIAGAVAAAGPNESQPTDPRGRTELFCSGLVREGIVGALGYLATPFELPNNDDVERRVTMAAATLVEVRITVPDIEALRGGFVRVSSPTILFDGELNAHYDAEVRAGAGNLINCRSGESGAEAFCQFHSGAPIRWNRLRAGPKLTFELLAPSGDSLASETITLQPCEHRTIELKANPQIRSLRGIVVDRDGHALALAQAVLDTKIDGGSVYATTDASGSFVFSSVFAEEARLTVRAQGFVTTERTVKTQRSRDEDPVVVALDPARVVRVTAEDSQGHPVGVDALRAERDGIPNIPGATEGDVWLVKGVPEGEVSFVLTAQGREWRQTHDTRNPSLRFVLPPAGSVAIKLTNKNPKGTQLFAAITVEGTKSALWPRERLAAGDELRFPAVAPGSYRLRVWIVAELGVTVDPKDLSDTNKTIEVRSGETTTVMWDGALR